MKRPIQLYERSSRWYPRKLLDVFELDGEYDPACEHPYVDKVGFIRWREHRLFVSSALRGEQVTLDPLRDTSMWAVTFGPVHIGHLDEERLERGLILPKKTRARVSGVSLG